MFLKNESKLLIASWFYFYLCPELQLYFAQFVLSFLCFDFPLVLCDSWLQGHFLTDILLLDIQGTHNCAKDAWT